MTTPQAKMGTRRSDLGHLSSFPLRRRATLPSLSKALLLPLACRLPGEPPAGAGSWRRPIPDGHPPAAPADFTIKRIRRQDGSGLRGRDAGSRSPDRSARRRLSQRRHLPKRRSVPAGPAVPRVPAREARHAAVVRWTGVAVTCC